MRESEVEVLDFERRLLLFLISFQIHIGVLKDASLLSLGSFHFLSLDL